MQAVCDPNLTLQYFPPLHVLPATYLGNVPVHGLRAQMHRKMMVGSLRDKIPAPGLRRSSSRSNFPPPPRLEKTRQTCAVAPSDGCRARSPSFRSRPIRSHLFSPQEIALQQISERFVVYCKERAALPGILETFVT